MTTRRPRRVLVIGAGMSGLACAKELQQRQYQVLVVEARGRVGGRLKGDALQTVVDDKNKNKKKSHTDQHCIDLGGALIHGIDDNPLYGLTQDLGVTTQSVQDCLLMNDSGWPVDPKQDEKVSTVFNECLEESFQRIAHDDSMFDNARSTRSAVLSPQTSSFGDLFQQVCREKKLAPNNALFRWHQANLEVSCGASFAELGWQWNEDEPYGFDGNHVALPLSWKAVVESLADDLDIWYDAAVTRIQIIHPTAQQQQEQQDTEKALPKKRKTEPPVVLSPTRQSRRLRGEDASVRRSERTNKGATVDRFTIQEEVRNNHHKRTSTTSSFVQVTIQQGTKTVVLQADAVVCTLPLGILKVPQDQSGSVVFDPPLPVPKQQAIERLGTGLLNKCALSFSHVFWQDVDFLGLAEEPRSYLVLNGAAYTEKPILVFMYGGSFAKEIENWTDEDIVQDCLGVLKKICGFPPPQPIDYHVTRWGHEQYSRMAFTYIPPGVDGFADLCTMSEPILDYKDQVPVLMFAGEHTTPYHPSTIHGAFLSGIREAYRLDFAVDPEGNGNLQFSDQELYQRTFAVERKFSLQAPHRNGVHAESSAAKKKKSKPVHTQHRRRGAAGVMTLRKLPNKVPVAADLNDKSPKAAGESSSPTRRSQRSKVKQHLGQATNGNDGMDEDDDNVASDESALLALEDRILSRAVESYGHDYDFICEKTIPVHGSTSRKTLMQVRNQCQKLANMGKPGRPSRPKNALKNWSAKTVAPHGPSSGRI